MKKHLSIFTTILLAIILCACNLPKGGSPTESFSVSVGTKVASTLAALTQIAQETPLVSPSLQSTNTQLLAPSSTLTPTLALTPTLTLTVAPTDTPIPNPGTIAGSISGYPYGSIPSLVVVAYKQKSSVYWYVITSPGNTFYSMTDSSNKGYVTPGSYQVVAYDASGNSGGCTTIVTVISEQTVTCDITNWGSGYPAKLPGIPNP